MEEGIFGGADIDKRRLKRLIEVDDFPELSRRVTKREYERVVDFALTLGIENGFIQDGEVAKDSFIPTFDGSGVYE